MEQLENRVSKLEDKVTGLETRVAVAESNIKDINKKLDSISNNTTWILRIIIGAIIMAILGLVFKGGI
ncbi:hemolysin XhlA family protein [Neobacillus niacini]|uniref:hemolysin XhlA family protein n=1 Tax=Neobacillus niacini TaxID=86668 RepID=UPI003B025597